MELSAPWLSASLAPMAISAAAPHPSIFSCRRHRSHPLPGPAQAPARLDPPRRPPPSSPSLDPSLPRPSRPDPRCRDLFGSICRPFGWIASSRLDPSLPWPSWPDLPFPLLFCRGHGHHDRRRRVRCCRPSWRSSLTPDGRRSRKVGLSVPFCCVVLPIVDARTSTPSEDQAFAARLPTLTTSTSATSTSRGYRLLGAHTGLYSSRNIRTITTLRLRGDFNPSAPTFGLYSSLIVCGAPVATAGGC
jgi:hypothetical protein